MAIIYKSNIDLGGLQLQNAAIHPTDTQPSTGTEGQVYFNTTAGNKKLYVYDGSTWIDVTGDVRSISAGTGIGVTDGSGGDATVSLSHLGLESLTSVSSESADQIFMYDTSLGGAAYLSVNTASGITIDSTNNDLKLSSIPNSSLSNSSVTVSGGNGMTSGSGGSVSLGGSITMTVGAGLGITVNTDDVAIKNAGNFSDNTVLMWDDTNGQLVDSAITDDGTTIELGSDSDTRNVIVSGNLTVEGTTTTVDSNTVNIGDNIIVLNADETGDASQDAGIEIERGNFTNASFLWIEGGDYWKTSGKFAIGAIDEITSVPAASKFLIGTGTSNVTKYATLGNVASSLGLGNHTILLDAANRDNVQKNATGEVYEVWHGLGTKYVMVTILDATSFEEIMVETTRPTTNTVKVHFAVAPDDGDYICMTSKVGVEDTANLGNNFGDSGGGGTEAP